MWQIRETADYVRTRKYFAKKHRNELSAMLDNLDTYVQMLQEGVHPRQIRLGFTHGETHGAIAIDQRGAVGKPTQTRLYVYPDPDTECLYLITIGDKRSQRDDNATCRQFIVSLGEEKQQNEDNREESTPQEGDSDGRFNLE
jgi:hypothetical protein